MADPHQADPSPLERRVLAIMATDVVGYSRQMEADEAGTIARVTSLRAEIIDPLLDRHHGRLIKLIGDGTLSVFDSVVDAVNCAAAIQRAVRQRNEDRPEATPIVLRVGINLGDVALLENDVYGDGVNVAARLEGLCDPGGVMISGTAYDHLQGKTDLAFKFVGEQQVKNITRPVRAYRARALGDAPRRWRRPRPPAKWLAAALMLILVAGGGWWWWSQHGQTPPTRASIAVLPFHYSAGDDVSAKLAEGLTNELATDLARFHTVDVIAGETTRAYSTGTADVRKIGQALSARYVLDGTIQRQDDRFRISLALVAADSAHAVWADHWDQASGDLLQVQGDLSDTMASRIASPYTGKIVAADRDVAKRKSPNNRTPYDLFLLGTEARERGNRAGLDEAIELLRRSVEVDPDYAQAWAALSMALGDLAEIEGYPEQVQDAREAAAHKAVELDPLDPTAHVALATVYMDSGNAPRAQAEFDSAFDINPNSADLLAMYAGWASDLGAAEDGAKAALRANQLDPEMPPWAVYDNAYAFFMAGHYDEARRLFDRMPREAYTPSTWVYRAATLGMLGDTERARDAVADALTATPDLTIEAFAHTHGSNEAQRRRLIETMRAANFPVCAGAAVIAASPGLHRLPECAAS